tara:strand:- start:201 stop:413 length:213 start_codon:yes stop_codon:yes gene_type:complete
MTFLIWAAVHTKKTARRAAFLESKITKRRMTFLIWAAGRGKNRARRAAFFGIENQEVAWMNGCGAAAALF